MQQLTRLLRKYWRLLAIACLIYAWQNRQVDKPLLPPGPAAYLLNYQPVAQEISRETGIPIAIILAVGGLESGWGASELSLRSNNHFGIKSWSAAELRCCMPTQEFVQRKGHRVLACFRAYPQAQDSFRDFARKIASNERYSALFKYPQRDYRRWAEGLQSCGYATDPDYANKLIRVVESYGFHQL